VPAKQFSHTDQDHVGRYLFMFGLARWLLVVVQGEVDCASTIAPFRGGDFLAAHNMEQTSAQRTWSANAEMLVRDLHGFNDGTSIIPRIAEQMRMPAFRYSACAPYAWPRPRLG
jgi:hypothetical protein